MEFSDLIKISKVDRVTLYRANQTPIEGTLCITSFYLILSSRNRQPPEELWLLHKSVDFVERRQPSDVLTLKCKDFQILKLQLPSIEVCASVADSIEALSNLEDSIQSISLQQHLNLDIVQDGWKMYSTENEFKKLQKYIGSEWRLSYVNEDFKVCPTYPPAVVVLKEITDEMIRRAAPYRHYGRFPVLAYYHRPNGMVMMRCSQPLSRGGMRRNKDDEKMVNGVITEVSRMGDEVKNGDLCSEGVGVKKIQRMRGYIVDTRTPNVIKLESTRGGGSEPEQFYSMWRQVSYPIDTTSQLQDSLVKLVEACLDAGCSSDKWLSRLDSSNWLANVADTLYCSQSVARYLEEGGCVLLRGGGEVDTQLVVSSLAQLLLDPEARTLNGFEALIEREWVQAGHPFSSRCIKGAFASSRKKTEAPVFLLFLDCVFQIWMQFSYSFQFNTFFLVALFKHAYASQFGTFLMNNERERNAYDVRKKTTSLWSYINSELVIKAYLNPLYKPNPAILKPSTASHSLQLWTEVYQSWQRFIPSHKALRSVTENLIRDHEDLKEEVTKLRKYVARLQKETHEKGLLKAEPL